MRILLLTVLLTCAAAASTVTGTVRDGATGQPLPDANVRLTGTGFGAKTDDSGSFAIEAVPPGRYEIRAEYIGYEPGVDTVSVSDGAAARVDFALTVVAVEMGAIETVVDFDAIVRRSEDRPSTRRMESARLRSIAGAVGDLSRGLSVMPGVITGGDFSAQLFVRGGGPDQNEVLVDGVPVSAPYNMGLFVSAFNPDMVEEATLYPGGFPARWGNRLSAVLDVKLRDGEDRFTSTTSASLLSLSTTLEGPLPDERGNYIVGLRRTYYDLVANQVSDEEVAYPFFADATAKLTFRTSSRTRLRLVGYFDDEGMKLTDVGEDSPDSLHLELTSDQRKGFASAELVSVPSEAVALRTRASYLFRKESFNIGGNFSVIVDAWGRRWSFSEEMSLRAGAHEFDVGAEYHHTYADFDWRFVGDDSLDYDRPPGSYNPFVPAQNEYEFQGGWTEVGSWLSDRFPVSSRLGLELGVRADYSNITDNVVVSPRTGFSYKIDPITTLRGSVGLYRQFPNYESYSEKGYFPEFELNPDVTAEQSIHYLLGLDCFLTSNWRVKVEGYYRDMSKLLLDRDTTFIPVNEGDGQAYGVETYVEKRSLPDARLSGWVSYALSRTRLADPWNGEYDAAYDQRHTVNVVFDYKLNGWLSVGGTWRFGSGFPYTPVAGVEPIVVSDTANPSAPPDTVDWEPVWGEVNSQRYPAYHRLDLRVSFSYKWLGARWTSYVEGVNVYDRKNVYSYDYDRRYTTRDATYELPLLPSFGFTLTF